MSVPSFITYVNYQPRFQRAYFNFWQNATKSFPVAVQEPQKFANFERFLVLDQMKKIALRLLCVHQNEIIGTITFCYVQPNVVDIHYFYVLPQWRGLGLTLALKAVQQLMLQCVAQKQSVLIQTHAWQGHSVYQVLPRIFKLHTTPQKHMISVISPLYGCAFFQKFLHQHSLWEVKDLLRYIQVNPVNPETIYIHIRYPAQPLHGIAKLHQNGISYTLDHHISYEFQYTHQKNT